MPGDPPLVRRAVEVLGLPHDRAHQVAHIRDVPGRDARAFDQVVVVGSRVVGLDIGACSRSGAAVELHPAMHADHPNPVSDDATTTASNVQQLA